MKKYIILSLCSILIIVTQCTTELEPDGVIKLETTSAQKGGVPFISAGHGAIFNNGKEFVPDEKFILQTQNTIISLLQGQNAKNGKLDDKISLINKHVKNEVLRNALIIDEQLDAYYYASDKTSKNGNSQAVRLEIANNILRSYYVRKIQSNPILPFKDKPWHKGLDEDIALILERAEITVSLVAIASGEQYIAECRNALVPVPTNIFNQAGWKNLGIFDNEFIQSEREAELWIYRSEDPPGVCLALPRYDGQVAGAFGIICMNTQNGNTCFFDNPRGTSFPRGENRNIEEFIGGFDLWNGRCTDCHAGENPFIVHPDSSTYPPFDKLTNELSPMTWHNPLVPVRNEQGLWPQNPEPDFELSAIIGDRNCTDCHVQGGAGRLPMHLDEVPGFCGTVLKQAITGKDRFGVINPSAPTMPPPGAGDLCEYAEQVNFLFSNCNFDVIPPCPDQGFDDFYLECEVNVPCNIFDEMQELPDIPVGCEIIDCCEGCPNFEDYLDVVILWRSELIKTLQFTSITAKGEEITQTIYNDQTYRIRLKRSQKDFKNKIEFSAASNEDYNAIAKQIEDQKIEKLGKIIVTQLMDNQVATTKKIMIRVKTK